MKNKLVEQVNKETIAALNHHFNSPLSVIYSGFDYLIEQDELQAINSKIKELSEDTWGIITYIKNNSNYISQEAHETPEEQIKAILGNVYNGINKKVENVLNISTEIKKHIKSDTEEEKTINMIINEAKKTNQLLEKIKHGVPYKTEEYSPSSNMLILPKPNKNQ